jgi:hypothetical protein
MLCRNLPKLAGAIRFALRSMFNADCDIKLLRPGPIRSAAMSNILLTALPPTKFMLNSAIT